MEETKIERSKYASAALIGERRQLVGWEWGDDICPPWWPRRWPRRWPRPWPGPLKDHVPDDVRAVNSLYQAATLFASTFQFDDEEMVADTRKMALGRMQASASVLSRGASLAWPWEWTWWCGTPWRRRFPPLPPGPPDPPRPPWSDVDPDGTPAEPQPQPNIPVPILGAVLLDVLSTLEAYNVAAEIGNDQLRRQLTTNIGEGLQNQLKVLADRSF